MSFSDLRKGDGSEDNHHQKFERSPWRAQSWKHIIISKIHEAHRLFYACNDLACQLP